MSIFLFTLNSFGQFSNKKMDRLVTELTQMVTDSSYINPDPSILEELDEPILEYWVKDSMTYNEASPKPKFSDNETYSTLQKIYRDRKGIESDFIIMTKCENPAIRVYGFWALLKNKHIETANEILKKEVSETVYWDSFGCEVFPRESEDLMTELLENHKKYGS